MNINEKGMKYLLLLPYLLCSASTLLLAQSSDSLGIYFNSSDGTKIYYEVRGTGTSVLLIHGFIVNGESWKRTELYHDLQIAGFKVITIDLRGNGKSDKPHELRFYENDAEAKDIMALVTLLGFKKYAAVGYSRGSIITSRLLILDKRLKKAVLGGMGADFTDPNWTRRELFYKALMNEPVPELEGMVKYVKSSGLDQLALAYLQKAQPTMTKAEFAKVKRPVLVIAGIEDNDNGKAEALAALIKKASVKRVPGVHNNAHHSKEFATAVIDFLK